MIDPAQIPDEVVEALIATLHGKPGLPYREALAAALNAWSGARERPYWDLMTNTRHVEIILPQEARDDQNCEHGGSDD